MVFANSWWFVVVNRREIVRAVGSGARGRLVSPHDAGDTGPKHLRLSFRRSWTWNRPLSLLRSCRPTRRRSRLCGRSGPSPSARRSTRCPSGIATETDGFETQSELWDACGGELGTLLQVCREGHTATPHIQRSGPKDKNCVLRSAVSESYFRHTHAPRRSHLIKRGFLTASNFSSDFSSSSGVGTLKKRPSTAGRLNNPVSH